MAGSFALASAWVDIGAKTANWDRALSNVKKQVSNLGNSFTAFSSHIYGFWGALAGAGGGAALAVHAYEEQERADQRLRSALSATGQEVENNFTMLKRFSAELQRATIYTDQGVEGLMAYATNLGVSADKMEDVIKVGVGLGEAFFGGDAQAGIEAAAKAQQGIFRELERVSKAVKDAATPQAKLNAVVKLGNQGLIQAEDRTRTFEGATKQLGNQITELAEGFGALLVPGMMQGVQWMKATVEMLEKISPAQKMTIIHFGELAAGIAGVLIFGPPLLSFIGDFISLGKALGSVLLSIGRLMIASLFTPIGLIVGGLGIAATAFAYFAGSGTTALGKIANGFGQIWNVIDTFLGSFQGMSELWQLSIETTANTMLRVWTNVKYYFGGIWDYMGLIVVNSLDYYMETLFQWGYDVVSFFERLGIQIGHAWGKMTDYLGDKLAKLMLMAPNSVGGMGMTGEQADREIEKVRKGTDKSAEDEYTKRMSGFNRDWQDSLNKMDEAWRQRVNDRVTSTASSLQNRDKQRSADLAAIDNDEAKSTADRVARMSKSQGATLSGQMKTLIDSMMKGTGVESAMHMFDDLKKQIEQTKQETIGGAGAMTVRPTATGTFTSLEESFKKNLEGQFVGARSLSNITADHTTALGNHIDAMGRFNNSVVIFGDTVKNMNQNARFGR